MLTIVWVPRRDRSLKWARWYVLDSGERVAFFEKLPDAIDFVATVSDMPDFPLDRI